MLIDIIAGTRPNFVKIAPLVRQLQLLKNDLKSKVDYRLVHTGQHYDTKMSAVFFEQLEIPHPDVNFSISEASQAVQVGKIMFEYEKLLQKKLPDYCLVVGDVNSTMATAISAVKAGVKVAHVEAGLRSFDWLMPEEINRKITDSITSMFFTTSISAKENLLKEGVDNDKIHFVGNIMIDTLVWKMPKILKSSIVRQLHIEKPYVVLTLHRVNNSNIIFIGDLIKTLEKSLEEITIVFPAHPRNKTIIDKLTLNRKNIKVIDPLPYVEFNALVNNSICVITDSGGVSEETTFLRKPCITLRDSTERPETVTIGSNVLIGNDMRKLDKYIFKMLRNDWHNCSIPDKWDGKTADRILNLVVNEIEKTKL